MVEPTASSSRPRRSTAAAGASALARQAKEDAEGSDVSSPPSSSPPPARSQRSPSRTSFRPETVNSPQKVVRKGKESYKGSAKKQRKTAEAKAKARRGGGSPSDDDDTRPEESNPATSSPTKAKHTSSTRAIKRPPLSPPPSSTASRGTSELDGEALDVNIMPAPRSTTARARTRRSDPDVPPVSPKPTAAKKAGRPKRKASSPLTSSDEDERPRSAVPTGRRLSISAPSPKRKADGHPPSSISSPTKKLAASKIDSSQSSALSARNRTGLARTSSQGSLAPSARTLSRTTSLVFGSSLAPSKETKWNLKELSKVVWVRLAARGGVYAEEDDADGSFWWPAKRETADMDLSRETCVVRLFQLDNDAPLGPSITVHDLSSSNITNLYTGSPRRYHFDFSTFSHPPSATPPTPKSSQPQGSSSTLTPLLSSIDKSTFESVVKLAREALDRMVEDELDDDDDLDTPPPRKTVLSSPAKTTYLAQANAEARALRGDAGKISDDDEDHGPKFFPDARVFVYDDHHWWGGVVSGPGTERKDGGWAYPCTLVLGKSLRNVKQEKIKAQDQLSEIHDQPWGMYQSTLAPPDSDESDDDHAPIHHASTRPSTPDPSVDPSATRPFEKLAMWEQLVRCRPILERIIKGDYPPAVKAHREATSTQGLRLNMNRDSAGYGSLTEPVVEEWILPELQRWALREIRPDAGKDAPAQDCSTRPVGDAAYERLSETSKEKYVAGFLLRQTLIELCMLEHGLRDAHPAGGTPASSSDAPLPAEKSLPVSAAPIALEADVSTSSTPEASTSTIPSSLPTEPGPPISSAIQPDREFVLETDSGSLATTAATGSSSDPTFDPAIEYDDPLDYFPPPPAPAPTPAQLAHAAHEISLFKLARAAFDSEESADPFAWVRKEYSLRVTALETSWRNENARRQEDGEMDVPMSKVLEEAKRQGEEMELEGDGEGEEMDWDVEGDGEEGPRGERRSRRRTKGKRAEPLRAGGSGGGKGSISRRRGKGRK